MSNLIENVSDTALWVATYRAEESERPDALFRDPLAARLAGEKGRRISKKSSGSKYTRWSVVMRTVVIDRFVMEQVAQGVDCVVNLGAGLDTRPYRLNLPKELRWVEVDFPGILDAKEKELAGEKPVCRLERISADLGDDQARARVLDQLSAGAEKILVITEGVIPYLTNEQVSALAKDLHARKSFRLWIVDYYAPFVLKRIRSGKLRRQMQNAPFLFNPGDWFGFFRERGWREREVRYLAEESSLRVRPWPAPFFARLLMWFAPEEKRAEMRKFLAYAILETS